MYISVTEAGKLLKASRQSVHTWINLHRLATTIIAGRRVVIQDDNFKALQKARCAA